METSSPTPHQEAAQIEQIPAEDIKPVEGLRSLRRPRAHAPDCRTELIYGGNEKAIEPEVTGISMQKVLIGDNLSGCASVYGSLLGENTGFQCVCCQQIEILEKTQMVYCIY
ncbi:hypothetical protein SO802_022451 [Lithocarpus litseifolius]|uniref:Uncharacterized protein n=1 Tax=Lithocarpus litseifolius TaxID=425828 RepID=A0AAW2C5D1_9ROSI